MRRYLNCTKEADLLEPYFKVEEFYYNMTGVNEYTNAIIVDKNCNQLFGESNKICKRILSKNWSENASGLDAPFLTTAIDSCYAKQRENSEQLLSRR